MGEENKTEIRRFNGEIDVDSGRAWTIIKAITRTALLNGPVATYRILFPEPDPCVARTEELRATEQAQRSLIDA